VAQMRAICGCRFGFGDFIGLPTQLNRPAAGQACWREMADWPSFYKK